jgi:hypothetical protein
LNLVIQVEAKVDKTIFLLLGTTLMVLLAVALLTSCNRKKSLTEDSLGFTIQPLKESEAISSVSLWNAYLVNKPLSDKAYKDKIIRVTGKIRFLSPKKNKTKKTCYIILEKDSSVKSFISGVQCEFIGNINDIAPDVKIGDNITIRGTCIGKVVNVFLENCAIGNNPLPPEKAPKPTSIKPIQEGISISAVALWEDYRMHRSEADDIYLNKVFRVKGIIRFFGPPRFWRGYTSFIILEADLSSDSLLKGVQCEFDGNVLKDFPELKKGGEVTIEGTGSSKFVNVFLKKCRIVK